MACPDEAVITGLAVGQRRDDDSDECTELAVIPADEHGAQAGR